jgi:hypothetical protein
MTKRNQRTAYFRSMTNQCQPGSPLNIYD